MNTTAPYRLLYIVTGLRIGGAETVLYNLVSNLDRREFEPAVITLGQNGPLGKKIEEAGVSVISLGFHAGVPHPRLIIDLAVAIRRLQPHLIQTWMYHADLVGGLAAYLVGALPVVWGIRHTLTSVRSLKPVTRAVVGFNALLSHVIPSRIICCAESARESHIRLGFSRKKMLVIPNGFDLVAFRPQPEARLSVRYELGLEDHAILIGLGARFAAEKDHATFVRAAAILSRQMHDVYFILWGKDVDWTNPALTAWINDSGASHRFRLLGIRTDVARLLAALDVYSISSVSEAFPNSVGEAMACGVPCAVTNAGDAAWLVGETGITVPPRNPQALAEAWKRLLVMTPAERAALGMSARQRIETCFSLPVMVAAYSRTYRDILSAHSG